LGGGPLYAIHSGQGKGDRLGLGSNYTALFQRWGASCRTWWFGSNFFSTRRLDPGFWLLEWRRTTSAEGTEGRKREEGTAGGELNGRCGGHDGVFYKLAGWGLGPTWREERPQDSSDLETLAPGEEGTEKRPPETRLESGTKIYKPFGDGSGLPARGQKEKELGGNLMGTASLGRGWKGAGTRSGETWDTFSVRWLGTDREPGSTGTGR